jgi:hypothetical protein
MKLCAVDAQLQWVMHYYNTCPPSADENIVAAWDSQLRRIKIHFIEQVLADHGQVLFQRFASSYAELRALPRAARRALQRKLAEPDNVGEISTEWRRKLACTVAGAALLVALGQTAEAGGVKVSTIKLGTKCTLPNAISAANYAQLITQPFNKKTAYYYGFPYSGCKSRTDRTSSRCRKPRISRSTSIMLCQRLPAR